MGTKVTIPPLGNPLNSSFTTSLNNDLDQLGDEFDNVVYRDGSQSMEGDLNMNSQRVYNLPAPVLGTEAVRLSDIGDLVETAISDIIITDILNNLSLPNVASRAALSVVPVTNGSTIYLSEAGREGVFTFTTTNNSTNVTNDPQQGMYIAPATDLTGASGVWARRFSGSVNVKWFGAVADDVTDDGPAFLTALALLSSQSLTGVGYSRAASSLFVPKGHYYLGTNTLDITTSVRIYGESGTDADGPSSVLRWAANTTGIRVQTGVTTGATGTKTEDGHSGVGSVIERLGLIGGYTAGDAEYHAIHLRGKAAVRDVYIERWQGDGIYINASVGGGTTEGNANNSEVTRAYIENTRTGVYLEGTDVNAGVFTGVNCKNSRAYGIWDSSFLGNTHVAHHVSGSGLGAYHTDSLACQAVFVGCYSESGQPASSLSKPTLVIGGTHAAGIVAAANGTEAVRLLGDLFHSNEDQRTEIGDLRATRYVWVHPRTAGLPSQIVYAQPGVYEADGITPMAVAALQGDSNTGNPASGEGYLYFKTRTYAGGGALTIRFLYDGPGASLRALNNNDTDFGSSGIRWKTLYGMTGDFTTQLKINGSVAIDSTRLQAGFFPTLTGDVTTAGGALATTIANGAVTYAKQQNVAASKLIGNPTGGSAAHSEIGLGANLGFNGTNLQVQFAATAKLLGRTTAGAGPAEEIAVANGITLTATTLGLGAITPTSVATTGALTSSSATAGVGYASGARGTQTQTTSKSQGVTSNTAVTDITMNGAALAADTTVSFVFTNSSIGANDTLILNHVAIGSFGSYLLNAHSFASGSCTIDVRNITTGSLSEAIVIRAVLVKGG